MEAPDRTALRTAGTAALALVALAGLVLGAVALALAVQNKRALPNDPVPPAKQQQQVAWLPYPAKE